MRHLLFSIMLICLFSISCKNTSEKADNPFFSEYKTPFGVPPFDKIKNEHYMPAFIEGMKQEKADIEKITNNTEAATFENTIVALDTCGELLMRVKSVFYSLTDANTNDTIQKIDEEISPMLSKHGDEIMMNAELFKRVKQVYEQKDKLNLTVEQQRLLEKTYKHYIRNGAALDSVSQQKLKKVNEELSVLSVKFGSNLLAETKAFQLIIDKKDDLAGLSQSVIEAAVAKAKEAGKDGNWIFTLDAPSFVPFMTYAENRSLREKMLKAYMSRSNNNNANDNKEVMAKLVSLRAEKAKLLGYKTYADYVLENRMAKTPENALKLLNKLWEPALKTAKQEAIEYQNLINKGKDKFKLEAWDWRYYAEKIHQEKYKLDEEQLRPYFSLDNVREGAFMVAHNLFGITFTRIDTIPVYAKDVQVFEVKDKDSSLLGILYMDFFPRASKRGGAWCGNFRDQRIVNGKNIRPVVSTVFNFTPPSADAPALLNLEEVSTTFHEFGHALQSLLSQINYLGVSSLVWDYVEMPSQVMENWATEPEVLKMYAKHYKTGEVMPQQLIDKIRNSGLFNTGFATTEYLAASLLDLKLHALEAPVQNLNVVDFEKKEMEKIGLIPEILPRYRATYFNHISDDGYAAGYYVYVWAEVLDADAFEAFKEKGIFDAETAQKFRTYVMEKGSSEDEMEAYKKFRGAEPSIKALLKRKGFE